LIERMMAKYLKKRGWVVFYLDEEARFCTYSCCWLDLYLEGEEKEKDKADK